MTTTIYYFTGTGNSLKIARDLAEKVDAELIPIAKVWQQETVIATTEKVGFVHPLYLFNKILFKISIIIPKVVY